MKTAMMVCDLCGKTKKSHLWYNSCKDYAVTWVGMESGVTCAGETRVIRQHFDVCPECFVSQIIPFFESAGSKPCVEEVNV